MQNVQPNYVDRNQYQDAEATYVVFVSGPTDKQSLNRRMREVNAVMPAVPRFMHWSEQPIVWSIEDHPKIMPVPGKLLLCSIPPSSARKSQ